MQIIRSIQNRIYELRGERVMLDRDLAALYETEIKVLNQSVKRNSQRFPADFMFQLTKEELDSLRFQFETLENRNPLRSQFVTLKAGRGEHAKYLPYAFTELGVAMLSSVLNNPKAIQINIIIMRTFVAIRQNVLISNELAREMDEIRKTVSNHGEQLNLVYEVIESFLDAKAEQQNWEGRERIGFKK